MKVSRLLHSIPVSALGIINLALVAGIAARLAHPPILVVPAGTTIPSLPALPPLTSVTETSAEAFDQVYASIVDKPAFHADRKYRPPRPATAEQPVLPPPDYVLSGFLAIPGQPARAYLLDKSQGRTIRMATGDSIGGWIAIAIDSKAVRLRQADQMIEVARTGTIRLSGADAAHPRSPPLAAMSPLPLPGSTSATFPPSHSAPPVSLVQLPLPGAARNTRAPPQTPSESQAEIPPQN